VLFRSMKAGTLRSGDKIAVQGKDSDFSQTVSSMQIESVDVKIARRGQVIGMKIAKAPKIGDSVYKM
jgi:hypothetical protein